MEEWMTVNESDLDVTLRDITYFINWMQRAVPCLEEGTALPATPDLASEQMKKWVSSIQGLQERYRERVEAQAALLETLNTQESSVEQMLAGMYSNMASLYDSLGYAQRAEEVRRRGGTVPVS